jgi:hypothetical protein
MKVSVHCRLPMATAAVPIGAFPDSTVFPNPDDACWQRIQSGDHYAADPLRAIQVADRGRMDHEGRDGGSAS